MRSSSSGTRISTCSAACRTSDRLCTRRANCSGAELLGVRWRTSGEDFPPEGRSKRKRLLRWGLKKGVGHPAAIEAAGRPGCSAPATLAPAAGRFPRTLPRKLAGRCLSVDAQKLRRTPLVRPTTSKTWGMWRRPPRCGEDYPRMKLITRALAARCLGAMAAFLLAASAEEAPSLSVVEAVSIHESS